VKRSPLKRSNPKRRKKLYEKQFGERGDRVREMPCLVGSDCSGPIQACHVVSRGAGGTRRDLISLCSHHHHQQHQIGILSFQEHYGLDLRAEADAIAKALDAEGVP